MTTTLDQVHHKSVPTFAHHLKAAVTDKTVIYTRKITEKKMLNVCY